jgi:hypothetical protein
VLALLVDQLLALIESGLRNRSRLRATPWRRRHRGAGRGHAGADHDALADELHRRRQDLHRTICAVGTDRAAAEGRRLSGTRAKASAPT